MRDTESAINDLLSARTSPEVERVIAQLGGGIVWTPLGNNRGNYGIVKMGAEPYDGITERITNAIDAMIEMECELLPELKASLNPRIAVERIYGFKEGNLRYCDQHRIGELASNIQVKFLDGDEPKRPTIEIWDRGIGQHPSDFPATLVSLNEDYKVSKLYLMGAFGQGGQTSLAHCEYGIVVSRKHPKLLKAEREDLVGWTIVRYNDPTTPGEIFKHGYWEYCVRADTLSVPTCRPPSLRVAFDHGTLIRLVSYSMPKGTSDVLQPASTAWSFLSQSLLDPLLPLRLFEARSQYENRNRPLTGLAHRLWGGGKGEKVQIWKGDSYRMDLGGHGFVRLNYWALAPTDELENWRDVKKGFVSGSRAMFITLNGQTHGVELASFLRDSVGLTYSHDYLIVQVDCDGLTNQAKKELLSTTRDRLVEGEFKEELMASIIEHLQKDRNILAFERDRKAKILSAKSERDTSRIRTMVGRYIARNPLLAELIQTRGREKSEAEKAKAERREEVPEDEIREEELETPELKEVPTYLKIANSRNPIPIEKGGNALVRLETDAVDSYREAQWEASFRAFHQSGLSVRKSCSGLRNGKVSYHVHCPAAVRVGSREMMRFELDLPDGSFLLAEREIECVPPFDRRKEPSEQKLPEPKIIPVSQEGNPAIWASLGWDDDSVGRVFLGKPEDSGIYVSLDNKHLQRALRSKKLLEGAAKAVEERFVAGVAYYLLLKKVHEIRGGKSVAEEENSDGSPELQRLAETVAALSLPLEAL